MQTIADRFVKDQIHEVVGGGICKKEPSGRHQSMRRAAVACPTMWKSPWPQSDECLVESVQDCTNSDSSAESDAPFAVPKEVIDVVDILQCFAGAQDGEDASEDLASLERRVTTLLVQKASASKKSCEIKCLRGKTT